MKTLRKTLPTTNAERFFCTDHLKADLKGRSIRGGALTMMAQASRFVLQMGSTAVLARLLAPEDYGLIGMVAVVIRFVQLFKDLGLSAATVQAKEINHKQVSTLFWINLAVSCTITLMMAALAPAVASFYNEPRLTLIMLALAVTFIFGGLTVQHQALLRRQMRYASLARIEVISMTVGVVTAIISAWYGAGYWALVLMQLATVIANAVGVWVACRWRPGLPGRDSNIRSMLAFGKNLTGFRLVNYFSRNLDNVLIGRYWGPQALGLYDKAYRLVLLPVEQINHPVTSVALPSLSRLATDPQRYRSHYYKAILVITTIGMPTMAFLFAAADQVIFLFLGQQWMESVLIFRCLMPAAFLGTFNVATGWVYQSLGRTDRQFRWGVLTSTVNVAVFLYSVRWGAIGVAAGYSLSQLLLLVPTVMYCYRGTWLRPTELAGTLLRPAFASVVAAAVLMGIQHSLLSNFNALFCFFISCLLYGLLYLAIWMVLPNGRRILLEIIQMTKALKHKPRGSR